MFYPVALRRYQNIFNVRYFLNKFGKAVDSDKMLPITIAFPKDIPKSHIKHHEKP